MDNEQNNGNLGQASDEQRSSLDMLGELSNRIKALETDNADLRARLDNAQKGGTVEPYDGFVAHVAHVMQKYYYHEKPEPEASDETRKSAFAA